MHMSKLHISNTRKRAAWTGILQLRWPDLYILLPRREGCLLKNWGITADIQVWLILEHIPSTHTHIHTYTRTNTHAHTCLSSCPPTFKNTSIWGSGDVTSHTSTTSGRSANCLSSAILSWLIILRWRLDSFLLPSSTGSAYVCARMRVMYARVCVCVHSDICYMLRAKL